MFKTRTEFEGKIYGQDKCMSVASSQSEKFVKDCLQRRTEPGGNVGSVDMKQEGQVVLKEEEKHTQPLDGET
jgi:hypothetical protein